MGHAEALRRARLLTHIALSLVEEYQTLPLISPQEAVRAAMSPPLGMPTVTARFAFAIDTMMVAGALYAGCVIAYPSWFIIMLVPRTPCGGAGLCVLVRGCSAAPCTAAPWYWCGLAVESMFAGFLL